ncbi:heat shock 70 kDa protein 12A-like isoform X2 [Mercenaria mercenaria]|nr:heat shock 70 kDa protein 12A-like isoform X2 [Mercenaria mercenaria]
MASADHTKCKSKSGHIVVAAMDFGTTYSGYAYSLIHEYENDPTKVFAHTKWVAGSQQLISLKTPSILLLNPDKTFKSFGYEAENDYGDLAAEGKHKDYYYFRRFKMLLYNSEGLKRDMIIEDDKKKKMRAIQVFSLSINYLKNHLLKGLQTKFPEMKETDIMWVLTVPAIWNDGSKQFMREAAQKAGIRKESLIIALEPEAASLFCMHLPVDKMCVEGNVSQSSAKVSPFQKGTKYMVVDVGGGTVDITIHQVVDKDKLKEIDYASGGAWGGTMVDAAFQEFLIKLIGKHVYEKFEIDCKEDLVHLYREFETKKRNIILGKEGKETMKIPIALVETYENMMGKKLKDVVDKMKGVCDTVKITGDKLRVDADIMRSWFDMSTKKTIQHVQKLFQHKNAKDVNTILLVGGFSESPMLQDAMRKNFRDKRLIIPEDAGLAVLKGAVIFGHNPVTIVSRIAKFSYGVRVYRDFQDGVHPNAKKICVGGKVKCKDVFASHVKKGQELVVGEAQSNQRYTPLEADQMSLIFDIYTSTEENPMYVTDAGCVNVGQLEVEVPDLSGGKERGVWVQMIFGGTEIVVEAKDEKTGKITKSSFDFLQDSSQSSDAE